MIYDGFIVFFCVCFFFLFVFVSVCEYLNYTSIGSRLLEFERKFHSLGVITMNQQHEKEQICKKNITKHKKKKI
jgi:hypothetical protein